ncbi:hypothetical protein DFH06DRAFT_663217 [Mycena polygramma]|nr:hypothetical protein DFH06DRAFT_663217 [Mycena polygramma]
MRASKVSCTGLFFCVFTLLRVSIAPLAVYRPPGMRRSSATRIEGRPFESSTAKRPMEQQDRGKPIDAPHPCPSSPLVVFANLGRTAAPVSSSAGLADVHRWPPSSLRTRGARQDPISHWTSPSWHGQARAARQWHRLSRLCRCDARRRGGFEIRIRTHPASLTLPSISPPPESTLASHLTASPGARQDPVRILSPWHGHANAAD